MISDNLFAPQLPKDCDCCDDGYDCMKTEYQYADVSIPIKISPDIKVGKITSECTGKASICYCENCCDNSCEFTVTHKIKIKKISRVHMYYCIHLTILAVCELAI